MAIDKAAIVGVLLAGGQSRRMFGAGRGDDASGDKGLLDLGGRPMLAHVMERLAPQVGRMIVNANGDPARFAAFGLPVVADTVGGYVGPLAGVLAAMRWTATNAPDARFVVTVSTDAPFLPDDLVRRLLAAEGGALRYLHSTLVPDDESAFCVFEAASRSLVEQAYARAGVRFERLLDAVESGVGSHTKGERP